MIAFLSVYSVPLWWILLALTLAWALAELCSAWSAWSAQAVAAGAVVPGRLDGAACSRGNPREHGRAGHRPALDRGNICQGPAFSVAQPAASEPLAAQAVRRRTPLAVHLAAAAFQYCPRCRRAINVEDFAADEHPDSATGYVHLFCESCERGWTIVHVWSGSCWAREFDYEIGPERPREFARFKATLRNLTHLDA